jgi:DNA-binding beta-propeller fold protein YncE
MGKQIATLVGGVHAVGVAISPDGKWAFVKAETSNSVSVLDARRNTLASNRPDYVIPAAAAWAPDGWCACVTNRIGGTLTEIEGSTHGLVSTIPIDARPGSLP